MIQCAQPTLNEETTMSNLTFSSGHDAAATQASDNSQTGSVGKLRRGSVNSPGELARQRPNDLGYALQQFVRLAGQQCRMSADEVAYHNRAHEPLKRAG
jgi:hypothetical protein